MTGDPERMDGFTVKVSEAVCLGASFALSGICYYLYRKSRTTVNILDVSCGSFISSYFLHFSVSVFHKHVLYSMNTVHPYGLFLVFSGCSTL